LECDVKEYKLNYGKCKNGGYPDPLPPPLKSLNLKKI